MEEYPKHLRTVLSLHPRSPDSPVTEEDEDESSSEEDKNMGEEKEEGEVLSVSPVVSSDKKEEGMGSDPVPFLVVPTTSQVGMAGC